ncbi:MAG TPA: low specificity L-threonine aldolase [Candidatus Eisenbacteria bacterium]
MQFGSDNQTGASPRVLETLTRANAGHTHGYGHDEWTERAVAALRELFACDLEAFFVATGTAANALALSSLVKPWETILCHDQAHVILDESTAPEFFGGGSRIRGISRGDGKLEARHLERYFRSGWVEIPHNSRAGAVSVSQASENGLVQTPAELASLCSLAHEHGLKVHMDGARFSNAVASLGCAPADVTWKAGVDVLCLGATKNGALAAESVIFFRPELAEEFIHRRKRAGHLLSKGRLFGAQFAGWLEGGYWLELARHANAQAARLAGGLSSVPGLRIVWPVEANELFVVMPKETAQRLKAAGAEFYEWYLDALPPGSRLEAGETFIRLVTSFATTDAHVDEFCAVARAGC